jgi:hypothetical protein
MFLAHYWRIIGADDAALLRYMAKVNTGSLEMSQDEEDWLRAISEMNGETVKSILVQAWRGHLCRHKAHYIKKLRYLAERHGLTIEECFRRLVKGESLGAVVNEAPISAMEELDSNTFFGSTEEPK